MTFLLGLSLGLVVGVIAGGTVVGFLCYGRICDLQEANDAWEASRWQL